MAEARGLSSNTAHRTADQAVRRVLPIHAPGLTIGLLGGSFNPPHAAHRLISLYAMARLGLDRVWWLVTPGNPLKETHGLAPVSERVAAARALAHHPRIDVTAIEAALGTHYTIDTLRALIGRAHGVRFVWLMGADNLMDFHRWRDWQAIARLAPIAVVDRAGMTLKAVSAKAPQTLARWRQPETQARRLSHQCPPAWIYLFGVKSPLSSTVLRSSKKEQRRG